MQHLASMTWLDGYLRVLDAAYRSHAPICDHSGHPRPFTPSELVRGVARLVAPAIRRYGTPDVLRSWRHTTEQFELTPTYRAIDEFWTSAEAIALYLDDLAVTAPPPALWEELLATASRSTDAMKPA